MKTSAKDESIPGQPIEGLALALQTLKVTQDFFAAKGIVLRTPRPGEDLMDVIAPALGLTREQLEETQCYLLSLSAGRVIPRKVDPRVQ